MDLLLCVVRSGSPQGGKIEMHTQGYYSNCIVITVVICKSEEQLIDILGRNSNTLIGVS